MIATVRKLVDYVALRVAPTASAEAACGNCHARMYCYYQYRCAFGRWQRRCSTEWCDGCGNIWGPWRDIGRCFS
jgi:hypothetical protein